MRLLLDDATVLSQPGPHLPSGDDGIQQREERMCDRERYRFLNDDEDEVRLYEGMPRSSAPLPFTARPSLYQPLSSLRNNPDEVANRAAAEAKGGFAAVPFMYGDDAGGAAGNPHARIGADDAASEPETEDEDYAVPAGAVGADAPQGLPLPKSQKHYAIIEQTAKVCCNQPVHIMIPCP